MRSSLVSAALAACSLLAGLAGAQPAQSYPKVTIPGSSVRTIKAEATGRQMDLYIHLPDSYAANPSRTYPVLYVLDGQWDFKLMDSVLGGLVYDRKVPEMIMVGITYSGENPNYDSLRASDLTPSAGAPTASQNAANFLKFVKAELLPFIESNYRADPKRRVLQGNSLGGLFTVYTLFSDPGLFSGYVASSPAVNHAEVLALEAQFAKDHKELPARLFIGVGSDEGLSVPVQGFIRTLKSREYQGLKLETRIVEGDGHSGNKPETYNRGLRFVFAN
jgi:uncharacterized protein